MTFDPRQKMVIDADGDKFLVTCPFWANNLLEIVPSRRWNKSKHAWQIGVVRQNVTAIQELMKMAGVQTTPAASKAIDAFEHKVQNMGKRGVGFPSWFRFKTPPLKHQTRAIDLGYGLKDMALFMDMQTGKSWVAMILAVVHHMEGEVDAVLILVKRTLRRNWLDQLQEHCPIPFYFYMPDAGKRGDFQRWMARGFKFPVMAVGWESLSQGAMADLCREYIEHYKGRVAVIGDETTYITNTDSIRTRAALEFGATCTYGYALTGTPALEGPMNLFGQFKFLDPDIIGIDDFIAYRNRYAIMGGYQHEIRPGKKIATEIIGYRNLDELMSLIAPYSFQVLKKDEYDLPPKRYETRTVELTKEQRVLYDKAKRDWVLELKGSPQHVIQNVLELGLRLHQIGGGYTVRPREERRIGKDGQPRVKMVYDAVEIIPPDKNPKMLEVLDIVTEYKGKQGIIWVVYRPELDALVRFLRRSLAPIRIGEIHGGIKDADRQPIIRDFAAGNLDLVVANQSTGGMGYTMMAAEYNVFYNNTWKAIDRAQAEDRSWGQGQEKSGIWIDVLAERTFDIVIKAALDEKQDVSDYIRHRIGEVTALLDGNIQKGE